MNKIMKMKMKMKSCLCASINLADVVMMGVL